MQPLTENSTMSIALVIVLAGWLFWTVWWASRISTKLDMVIERISTGDDKFKDHDRRISKLETGFAVMKNSEVAFHAHIRKEDLEGEERRGVGDGNS